MKTIRNRRGFFQSQLIPALLLAVICFGATAALAADSLEEWARVRASLRYRLDVDFLYDHLSPNADYGDWHTATATLYVKVLPRITPFIQTGLFEREDSDGGLTVGAYTDWVPGLLYTYTAYTTSGSSEYLFNHRFDHHFYLNTGPLTMVVGGGYAEDHRDHQDWYWTVGPRVWRGRFIGEYRVTRYQSDPGAENSWSHLVSLGLGAEGRSWLFLTASVGEEAYVSTVVAPPQRVHHDYYELGLSYQRWLTPRMGLKGQVGWLDLGDDGDGYEKLGLGAGFFLEF